MTRCRLGLSAHGTWRPRDLAVRTGGWPRGFRRKLPHCWGPLPRSTQGGLPLPGGPEGTEGLRRVGGAARSRPWNPCDLMPLDTHTPCVSSPRWAPTHCWRHSVFSNIAERQRQRWKEPRRSGGPDPSRQDKRPRRGTWLVQGRAIGSWQAGTRASRLPHPGQRAGPARPSRSGTSWKA